MLIFKAYDVKGNEVALPSVKSFQLKESAGVPCDILQSVFKGEIPLELAEIHVLSGDETVFEGIVDEQITKFGENTSALIVARSTEALLIDNEAEPQSFANPPFSVIFRKYLQPLGIKGYVGRNLTLKGDFNVRKGESCMQVLEDFSKRVYGFVPKIRNRMVILADEGVKDTVVFSDECLNPHEVKYESLEHSLLRYNLLSEIRVRAGDNFRYSTSVKDEDAENRGIIRVRYLDSSAVKGLYTDRTRQMIASARAKEKKFILSCKGFVTGVLSLPAEIYRKGKIYEGLLTEEVKYTFSDNREYTTITLVRKEC